MSSPFEQSHRHVRGGVRKGYTSSVRGVLSTGGGPMEVDTGVKSLSSDLNHNLKITLEIKRRFVAQRGMFPTVVITDNPPEYLSPTLLLRSPTPGPCNVSRFSVALNDSAIALSALDPIRPIDCTMASRRHTA